MDESSPRQPLEFQLEAGISVLLKLVGSCTPAEQPKAEVLLTLEQLLKLRSREGDYQALLKRLDELEKRVELGLGVRTIHGSRRVPGEGK